MTLVFVTAARGQLSLGFMGHPPILLGTISMVDSLILMVMALVVFGPRRLPQIGRQIGKLMYEFRKASNDFKFQMEEELRNAEEADRRKKEEERQRALAAATIAEQASVSADPPTPSQTSPSPKYPEQYPPESNSADETLDKAVPRIQPPAIGETIARPSRSADTRVESSGTSANSNNVDIQESIGATPSPDENPPETTKTAEALNQHG